MKGYWSKILEGRISRRRGLGAAGGFFASAAFLAACGGDDEPQAAPDDQAEVIDSTAGKRGGKLVFQQFGDPGGLVLVKTGNAGIHQLASLTHSGLLAMANGRPGIGVGPGDVTPEPDLAAALPEQPPDRLTYTVKLERGAKFHNGQEVTSEDVKYSWDRYAFAADSAYKGLLTWLDKVEAPDRDTVVFKTKFPFADTVGHLTARTEGFILSKAHEEGPDVVNKLMGSGPYTFVERQEPIVSRFRRNPEYFRQPYPYFDEVEMLGTSDSVKRVADFITGRTHVTYWFAEDQRDEIKRGRPDSVLWGHLAPALVLVPRVNRAPFDDIRVRQAMSMSVNRKQISEAVSKGEAEPDNTFTWTVDSWGFRKPADLPGKLPSYYEYNPAEAKKLLSAANLPNGFESQMWHWDATVIGQGLVDTATLIQTSWRNDGIANVRDRSFSFAEFTTTVRIGEFEGMFLGPGGGGGVNNHVVGAAIKNEFWSPPQGAVTPSGNRGNVADTRLNAMIEKQLEQLVLQERLQTFRDMELLMAEEQYRIPLNAFSNNRFSDPGLKNVQVPIFHTDSAHYVKYWWFA